MAYLSPVDVYVVLVERDRVLLALRSGTGYADGYWNLPSGKLEDGEDALTAVIREAGEEIGLELDPADVVHTTTLHGRTLAGQGRLALFFAARRWRGEPYNREPHKCAEIGWYPLDALPDPTLPFTALGLACWADGRTFATYGWPVSR